jgi:hypothetical protein
MDIAFASCGSNPATPIGFLLLLGKPAAAPTIVTRVALDDWLVEAGFG